MIKRNTIIIILVLSVIIISCVYLYKNNKITKSFYVETLEYNSNIFYNDNINIYKIFAKASLSEEFTPIIENFDFDNEYYNNNINNNFKIIVFQSIDELNHKILGTINIEKYIPNNFFNNSILGIIVVPIPGLRYSKNENLYNKNGYLTFSVEIWDQLSNYYPALANLAMYFINIPK